MKNRIVEQPRTFTPDFKENGEMNPVALETLSREVVMIRGRAAFARKIEELESNVKV